MVAPPNSATVRDAARPETGQSERSYKQVIDNSIQGLAVLIAPHGIVFVNDAFCAIFGYSRDELIGFHLRDLHPGDQDQIVSRARARARGNERPHRFEIRARKKDGTELWVEYLSSVTEWNGERATLLAAMDITDRKLAEQRLAEQERSFRQLFLDAPVAMYRSVGTKIVDVNPALENLLGYTAAELKGKSRRDLMPPEDVEQTRGLGELRKSGELQVEHRMVRKDGSFVWVATSFSYADDRARDARTLIVHILDITARRQAEQRLAESEQIFRALFENAPVAMMRTVARKIVGVNAALVDLLGYSADELIGKSRRDLMPPQDAEKEPHFQELNAGGSGNFNREHRMMRKDGTPIWVLVSYRTLTGWDAGVRETIIHVQDLMARKRGRE